MDVCPDCGGEAVMVEVLDDAFISRCVDCSREHASPDLRVWRRVPTFEGWTSADTVYLAAFCWIFALWLATGMLLGGQL